MIELNNRKIEISKHAIDRASMRIMNQWIITNIGNEGLHTWLLRASKEALANNERDSRGRYSHLGKKFVFDFEEKKAILVTII